VQRPHLSNLWKLPLAVIVQPCILICSFFFNSPVYMVPMHNLPIPVGYITQFRYYGSVCSHLDRGIK